MTGKRLSILIYHRVLPDADPILPDEVDAGRFEAQVALLTRWFNVLPLSDAIAGLEARRLPPRAVTLTFDDGYADNLNVAMPILKRYGTTATCFVATDYLDGGIMFNDVVIESVRRTRRERLNMEFLGLGTQALGDSVGRRALIGRILDALKYLPEGARREKALRLADHAGVALPVNLMMTSGEVRDLRRAGFAIGAHTRSHPILARLAPAQAREEIADGRARLESILGERIEFFAYPNGKPIQDFGPEHVAMVRDLGFRAAVTTAWGAASPTSDRHQLPRFTPWDRSPMLFAARLMQYRFGAETTPIP